MDPVFGADTIVSLLTASLLFSKASSTMNQENKVTSPIFKPRMGKLKSQTSIYSNYPPNFTRALTEPTKSPFLLQRDTTFLADVSMEPETPGPDQKPIHNTEDTPAKLVDLTRFLSKTKMPSSSYPLQQAKARGTNSRLHSSKEAPAHAEDPQLYTVMTPTAPSFLKYSSELTCPDPKSLNTSPKHFALPKCGPPQKSCDSSKNFHSHICSRRTSPERSSIRKSTSPEKLSNNSKSPDPNRSNSGSRAPSPKRHSTRRSSTPQKHHDSLSTVFCEKSPERSSNFAALQKKASFLSKKFPELSSKSRSNLRQSSPQFSVVKNFNSNSPKTSAERCSDFKSVSPARHCESPKPQDCPNKSDARQPHLIRRKNIQKSKKAPLPRKVRYKISASKTYVKYTKPKSFKNNESRLRPMSKNIEVLYLTELNGLVDRFMNSVMGNRTRCPVLTERLKSHQHKCPVRTKCDSTPAQTKCTLADSERLNHKSCDKNRLANVHAIVKIWLNKIPVQTCVDTRSSAVQELINSIVAIEKYNVDDICYQRSVNIAADRYLNEIRISHPGPRQDKNAFKTDLKKYLIFKLQQNRKKIPQKDQMMLFEPFADNTQEPSCNFNKIQDTKGTDDFKILNNQAEPSVNLMEKSAMLRSSQKSSCSNKPCPTKSHDSPYSGESKRNKVTLNLNSSARCGDVSPDAVDSFFKIVPLNPITSETINRHLYNSKFTDICETANQRVENIKDKILKHETNYLNTTKKLSLPTGNICLGDNSKHEDFNGYLSRKNTYTMENYSEHYRRYHRDSLDSNENNNCETKTASCKQIRNESVNSHNMTKFNHCAQFKNPMVCGDACPRTEKNKKNFDIDRNYRDIEKEIDDWLKTYTFIEQYAGLARCRDKSKLSNALLSDLKHYLNQPHDVIYKSFLKGRITTILKSFYASTGDPILYESFITRFADDLANRFVEFLSRLQCNEEPQWKNDISNKCYNKVIIGPNVVSEEFLRLALLSNIDEYFQNKHFAYNKQIKETILDLLMDNIELIQNDLDIDVKNNIIDIIKETNILSDYEIEVLVDNILKSCKDLTIMLSVVKNNTNKTKLHDANKTRFTSVSVLTSLNDMTPSFNAVTSTPKKKPKNQQYVSQLNPEQQAYTENIKEVIKLWVDSSPPNFKYRTGSEDMTEVMVEDLSGEICDHFRLEQIINRYSDKEQVITIYIYKWLLKYEVVGDLQFAESYTKELVSKILQVTVPNMTKPQHGNRQDIEMIKQAANTQWTEPYYPQVQDILEDHISVFMNEYPTEIFVNTDKNARVHELAEKIQPKLDNANSNKEFEKEVKQWMKTMILPRLEDRADDMAHSLVKRLKQVPHHETLAQYGEKTKQQRLRKQREKHEQKDQQEVAEQGPTTSSTSKHNDSQDDNDKTMTRFVAEYLDHCHAEEDPTTKKIFAQILKSELRRLDHNALKDVYAKKKYEQFNAEKLSRELMYIKEVSDWLKTIPLESFYNTVENTDRTDFVLGVAKNIMEVEEERRNAPGAMDYDVYLGHNIAELFGTLPILPSHRDTVHLAVIDLLQRLAVLRGDYIEPVSPGQGILNFIEEFMNRHGPEIANDKLKLEAWSARLLNELKQLLIEGQVQDKEGFEQRLQLVPKPGDESVKQFNLELAYAKEIVDWLKNLGIRKALDESNVEELAHKMADYKMNCPGDSSKTKDIVHDWVKQLPINENEKNNIPTLTMELANRLEKVTEEDLNAVHPADLSVQRNTCNMCNKNTEPNRNFAEPSEKYSERNDLQEPHFVNSIRKTGQNVGQETKNPADIVLEIVEKWCDRVLSSTNLSPVESEKAKNILESKIIMKICELNSSSSDLPYAYLLGEEVKKTLSSLGLPSNNELISQLTLAIESLRPMFIEDKSRYAYSNELQIAEPSDIAMNEEIAENSLKQEVSNFLTQNEDLIKNKKKVNQIKDNLSSELTEIFETEGCCHNKKNDEKIKTAVKRNMKKLSASIPKAKVNEFVDNLIKNETARKQTKFSKSDPRNLSLPTHLTESNRRQSLQRSLPASFKDYPLSPIAIPEMVPYPPLVLPETFNASWNASDYSQVPQQNIDTSGRSAVYPPSCMMPPGQAPGANVQQDTTIPPLPQFNRFPPLIPTDTILTWNSTQPNAELASQNIPAGVTNTRFSPISENASWSTSKSGAQFEQQNVPANVHIPPTGISQVQSPYAGNMQPPQDISIPTLPQFNRFPPLIPTDTISSWNSTQPSAVPLPRNIPASISQTGSAQVGPPLNYFVQGPSLQVPPSSSFQRGTTAGGLQQLGPQIQSQIPDGGLRSTRSLGLTTKPLTSEFGGQKSFVPCPFMLPVPACLADYGRLSRINLQQQMQVLQDTIHCDCENCMEGYPLQLLSGLDGVGPCRPYPPNPANPTNPSAPPAGLWVHLI